MDFTASINGLLDEASAENNKALKDWLKCFNGSISKQRLQAVREIQNTLEEKELQSHPERNFLVKLISGEPHGYKNTNGVCERRFELFTTFVIVMNRSTSEYWREFIATTLRASVPLASVDLESSMTSRLASIDCLTTSDQLHTAAKLEQVDKVQMLIRHGSRVTRNEHKCTPIHSAAMAILPNAEIAKLLVGALPEDDKESVVNQKSSRSWGRNTALHIAAANVNVTQEFINALRCANPRTANAKHDTPFHVAAKSSNPDAIIYLLNTFAPTNFDWDVDNVDPQERSKPTLIKMCARSGNAKAVRQLIQHGADISSGVLHEVVLESVRRPDKVEDLIEVYRVIMASVVTWYCLEEKLEVLPFNGYKEYTKIFRRCAIWLLTHRLKKYKDMDVLQCAIAHGAERLLWHIINTKSIFRSHPDENNQVRYDVSNFTEETSVESYRGPIVSLDIDFLDDASMDTESASDVDTDQNSDSSDSEAVQSKHLFSDTRKQSSNSSVQSSFMESFAGSFHGSFIGNFTEPIKFREPKLNTTELHDAARSNDSQVSKRSKRKFSERNTPKMPYLTYLLNNFELWKNSDILSRQPFKSLTKPYFALVQRFYLICGLMQLAYMILFSVYYMPETCSLSVMFNFTNLHCSKNNNGSLINLTEIYKSDSLGTLVPTEERSYPAFYWLIWPAFLVLYSTLTFCYSMKHECLHVTCYTAHDVRSFLRKFCLALIQSLPLKIFCATVPIWFYQYRYTETYTFYAEVTALVLLFGWITNLIFFRTINKNVEISALVVKEIVMEDFGNFVLFFGFTVVGFSFAMHALKISTCSGELNSVEETFYSVLSSAFGIGDFFEETVTNPLCEGKGTRHLFEAMYFGYVCTTMIILLNVLIAMMNHRYEIAKTRVENLWRYRLLSTVKVLENCKFLMKAIKNYNILRLQRPIDVDGPGQKRAKTSVSGGEQEKDPSSHGDSWSKSIACTFCCCYHDEYRSNLCLKHNRYYLRLVLAVDEN